MPIHTSSSITTGRDSMAGRREGSPPGALRDASKRRRAAGSIRVEIAVRDRHMVGHDDPLSDLDAIGAHEDRADEWEIVTTATLPAASTLNSVTYRRRTLRPRTEPRRPRLQDLRKLSR
jgi:hypothetical protein